VGQRGWRVHGLSVEGYRHRRNGIPCQDAWQNLLTGPSDAPVLVLAVADGAGSRPRSADGSRLAVELATASFGQAGLARCPDPDAVHGLLRRGFRDVRQKFLQRTGPQSDEYATTLTVLVLAGPWLAHVSVGDGFAVVRAGAEDGQPQFHLLPQPEVASEYSNETVFLTSATAERSIHTECLRDPGVDGLLLSTDGLAQAALSWSGGRPLMPNTSFVSAVFGSLDRPSPDPEADASALAELLRSDKLSAVNADDKTLLRAVRQ
jgi:hypothetical protein